MRKTIVLMALIALLFLCGIWLFCHQKKFDKPVPSQSGFDVVFSYGWVNGLETTEDMGICRGLNTFKNYIARCIGSDFGAYRKAKFILSQSDREIIRQKIKELNLANINPMDVGIDTRVCKDVFARQRYFLEVKDGDNGWNKAWDNCEQSGKINAAYANFASFMINFIESQDEFKKLDNDWSYFFSRF